MKDALHDIVQHTHKLGLFNLIKVMGTDKETRLNGAGEDQTVVLDAVFHLPVPELLGTFGMPNLNKLAVILDIQEYREDAKLTLAYKTENGKNYPSGINFVNKSGDFKNHYRFMSGGVVEEKLKTVKFKGVSNWDVEIEPSVLSIQRFRFQRQANSEETSFTAKTSGDKLEFHFGDMSNHAGNFVFHAGTNGKLNTSWPWPVTVFESIFALPGDKVVRFSDHGASQITVDSGLATYTYTIPALTK